MRSAAWRPAFAAAAALLASAAALAQGRIEPDPSPALGCLQVAAGSPAEPEYPFDQYKFGQAGKVKATVTLPGGLLGNDVELTVSEGDAAFGTSVRRYLRSLQAPCLKSGESVRLNYEFVFQPDQLRVRWSPPRDEAETARRALAKCIVHEAGVKTPVYPERLRRSDTQGRLMATLLFTAADQPPQFELHRRPSAAGFDDAVRDYIAGLRMPCFDGQPFQGRFVFVFRMEGMGAFGFKPLTLIELLSVTKGMRERALQLDTTTMGCPFQLKLRYFQPMRRNAVGEVEATDPRRRPLLELLADIELDLGRTSLDSVYADTADVTVPCFRLNLNPQEKKS